MKGLLLSGTFSLLTYNIAGLPGLVSGSTPEQYTQKIGPLLNAYDVVLVQEDFWYHAALETTVTHPHQSLPARVSPHYLDIGDGLNQFSVFSFQHYEAVEWNECNGYLACGNDCLASKGFTFSILSLADGAAVHLYNLHLDAGECEDDPSVRRAQVRQLAHHIEHDSAGAALIVAGDTNLDPSSWQDMATLDAFLHSTGLRDACLDLDCAQESIDRVLTRSSKHLALRPVAITNPKQFVHSSGAPLSDHRPVATSIRWTRR